MEVVDVEYLYLFLPFPLLGKSSIKLYSDKYNGISILDCNNSQ